MDLAPLLLIFTITIATGTLPADKSDTKSSPRSYTPLQTRDDYHLNANYYPDTHYQNPIGFNYRTSNVIPSCAQNLTQTYCLVDRQYPMFEISEAYQKYREQVRELFDSSFAVDTEKSVDMLSQLRQETYLCPTTLQYAKILRAMDINGRWRIIINVEGFFQTVRLETCNTPGQACPNLASCFSTNCLQKYVYQRLVVFNEVYDHYYNPFSVAVFKLPSSCCCRIG